MATSVSLRGDWPLLSILVLVKEHTPISSLTGFISELILRNLTVTVFHAPSVSQDNMASLVLAGWT